MSAQTTREVAADVPTSSLEAAGKALAARPYVRRGVPARDEPVRVLLVDDHALVRAGLRSILHHDAGIVVVGEGGDGAEAIALAKRSRPDVVVMDLDMPICDGLTAAQAIAAEVPECHVLILSMHEEREKLLEVLAAGARGYLAKSAIEADLVEAIRVVASGDIYVRPAVSRMLAELESTDEPERDDALARLARLSGREQTVVVLTAQGFNGPEIGRKLGITAKTVDTYKQRIEDKLGLSHRTDYVRFALKAGLLNDLNTPADDSDGVQ